MVYEEGAITEVSAAIAAITGQTVAEVNDAFHEAMRGQRDETPATREEVRAPTEA